LFFSRLNITRRTRTIPDLVLALWLAAGATALSAANATVPGALATPYPTLVNLAVEWEITGDDNLDCRVTVSYRKAGSSRWLEGMPLRRIKAGSSTGTDPIFSWKNKLSGSIFDLDPDTGYEIRLVLDDPDGGHAETTVTARTRPVPRAPADSVVKRADSTTFASVFAAASPGDVILLGRGHYGNGIVYKTGEPGRPIVVRADPSLPDSSVTFAGFNLRSARYVILDGVTVNGKVDLVGADNVAVVRCSVYAEYGITADEAPGCANCYIADNVVTWTNTWAGANMGADGKNEGEGIQLTGPGNVICYNRVTGYRDCISTMEDTEASNQVCIDIYNNDIRLGLDDGIESDFCMGNCRIMRNRLTNCFMGLSSQPSLGGPTYFIRNVMYNLIDCPFKLARYSSGDVVLHNTVVKVGDGLRVIHNPSFAYFRNNLAVGGQGGGSFGSYGSGDGRAMEFPNADSTSDIDYDGIGTQGTEFLAKLGSIKTYSIEELRQKTSEKHAVLVDMTVFAAGPAFPDPAIPERPPADLRLLPGSAAVDAGLFIPNVNDGFRGLGPDLGALEAGGTVPHYGPRPDNYLTAATCDLNADGRVSVADVLAFIRKYRSDPTDPSLDRDGDGRVSLEDVLTFIRDVAAGHCLGMFSGL